MGSNLQKQSKNQESPTRQFFDREIPMPSLRQISRRTASFWSVAFATLFLMTSWLLNWSYGSRLTYWSDVDRGTINAGVGPGGVYVREFRLIGSTEAFDIYCSPRPYLKANERDGQFQIWEMVDRAAIHKDQFLPHIQDASIKVYHNHCDHPDGADCLLNGTYFRERFLSLPIIYFNLFFLILAIVFARRCYRRTRPGCCRKCGYSLVGNESGVCPECGSAKGANPVEGGPAVAT